MKRLLLFVAASFVVSGIATAQDRSKPGPSLRRDVVEERTIAPRQDTASGIVTTGQTPEMWFYEQERSRYENPKEAVRRKAEFRATQRASRIASSEWYGMSNSRPSANATPLFGTYAPTWVSNSFDPYRWRTCRDTQTSVIIVR